METVRESNEIKRRAIRRLIVAVVLVLVAVGILTYLSYSKPGKTRPKPVAETLLLSPLPITGPERPALEPAETPAPPPPSVSTNALSPPAPDPKKASSEPPQPPVNATPTASKTTLAPSSYVVQLGVFSHPQNALQLVERLKQIGIQAQTETRVQLSAFKTKAEAEAALAKIREKGLSATLSTR